MAYWIVEDHGFCGQYYRCSYSRNVWIDTYEDIPEGTCPKCGRPINEDKTKYVDKPKKHILTESLDDTIIFPQTIGNITYYSKEELFEWVKQQQLKMKF